MTIEDNHNHFCIYCGARLVENQHFCSQCGKEVYRDVPEVVQTVSKYDEELSKIEQEYNLKQSRARELVEKLFDPSHMAHNKFTSSIKKSNQLFNNQLDVTRKMVELDADENEFVEREIENKLINKRNLSLIDDPTYVLTYYINFKTNNKDVATVPISQNIENYEITIKNTKTKPKMTITAKDISMTYKDKTNYNVQLIDTNGKPIPLAGETIKITIKTKEYNIKTNNNGTATLPINLNIGNYEITAKYNEKTIKNIIVVNKA